MTQKRGRSENATHTDTENERPSKTARTEVHEGAQGRGEKVERPHQSSGGQLEEEDLEIQYLETVKGRRNAPDVIRFNCSDGVFHVRRATLLQAWSRTVRTLPQDRETRLTLMLRLKHFENVLKLNRTSPGVPVNIMKAGNKLCRVMEVLKLLGMDFDTSKKVPSYHGQLVDGQPPVPVVIENAEGMARREMEVEGQALPGGSHGTGFSQLANGNSQDTDAVLKNLTSPNLWNQRLRPLKLDTSKLELVEIPRELEKLFLSLPEESLEKKLGLMTVKMENCKEIRFDKFFSDCAAGNIGEYEYMPMLVYDVAFVGVSNRLIRVTKMNRGEGDVADDAFTTKPSKLVKTTWFQMEQKKDPRCNVDKLGKLFYGNSKVTKENFLRITRDAGITAEIEDCAITLIDYIGKKKLAQRKRTVWMGGVSSSELLLHKGSSMNLDLDLGGFGYENSFKAASNFSLAGEKQIWFAYLLADEEAVKDEVLKEIRRLPNNANIKRSQRRVNADADFPMEDDGKIAVLPKLLLDKGLSCFPVVQNPGTIIYRHKPKRGLAKLRLGNGADMTFQAEDLLQNPSIST